MARKNFNNYLELVAYTNDPKEMKDQFSKFAHNTLDMFKNTQSTTNSESYNLVLKTPKHQSKRP